MRKFLLIQILFVSILLIVLSCQKDEFTEEDAQNSQMDLIEFQDSLDRIRDSLNHLGGIIQYSIDVVNASESSFIGKNLTEGKVDSVMVTVSQHGITKTVITDTSGIAVFNDLRIGTINVNIQATNFTDVDLIVELNPDTDPDTTVLDYYNVLRYIATMVPIFSTTESLCTIKGLTTYESNLTNIPPEIAPGVEVIGIIDVDHADFAANYLYVPPTFNIPDRYYGKIVQIAFSSLISSAVSSSAGNFSLQVPSTPDGLPIKLEVSDMSVNQQLLMNTMYDEDVFGVQTVRTLFSSNMILGGVTPSVIPTVDAAYVTFSAPTGSVAEQPDDVAEAVAVISESGIISINITNQGDGYTQAPIIEIIGDGESAEAIAFITDGKVTSVQITNQGQGYTWAAINVIDKEGDDAVATPVITYSITDYSVSTTGAGYQSIPNVVIEASSGSGASAEAIMSGYVYSIDVTSQGSDYVCPPNVIIDGSSGDDALATAEMTEYNSIHSIELTDNFTTMYETSPTVQIVTTGTGSGATALAQLSSSGSVSRIILTDPGLGYTEGPTVLIVGGGGQGAVAWADLNGDGSINVYVEEGGFGYTSDPTIEISAPPVGGTQAVGTAVREFEINQLVLSNTGSGYDIVYNAGGFPDEYTSEPDVEIDGVTLNDNEVVVRPNMSVQSVTIDDSGTEYTSVPSLIFSPYCGYGSGATAVVEIRYFVNDLEVVTEGSNYTWDADVVVTIVTPPEGCDEQAVYDPDFGNGILSEIVLIEGGSGYTAPPNVTIDPVVAPDEDASITAIISNGGITGFNITNPGVNYDYAHPSNFDVDISTNILPANLAAEANPESGKIAFVEITDPGEGYSTVPLVRFIRVDAFGNPIISHNFIDAVATAVIIDGMVASINITNPGTGYYRTPDVEIYIPNYNQTAVGTCIIDPAGHITGVNVSAGSNHGGMGYITSPTITFTASVSGMGQGASGIAVIVEGEVDHVNMVNMGDGYLGKNTPATFKYFSILPEGAASTTFKVYAGQTYIRDIYLGTGKRTIED